MMLPWIETEGWHSAMLALSCGVALVCSAALGCRYDPVVQDDIDSLPEEEEDPSELHRPGQPCVLCHSAYEGAEPDMAIGGTIYQQDVASAQLSPVEGIFVTIYDSAGASQKACTNKVGNFFVRSEDWPDARFPMTVQVGNRYMRSLIGRDRSCATCHQLTAQLQESPIDPNTGTNRSSAGAVLVDPNTVPPEQRCGPRAAEQAGDTP